MNVIEIAQGCLLGLLSGFFIFYTLQPQRPYPKWVLSIIEEPWKWIPYVLATIVLFYLDPRIGILMFLEGLVLLIDVEFLGRSPAENLK